MSFQLVSDLQATQNERSARRGIGRYVTEHARALVRAGAIRGLLLNPLLPRPGGLDPELTGSGLVGWNTATAIRDAAEKGPFAYHVMSPFEVLSPPGTVVSPHVIRGEIPLVVTLYDLVPFAMPEAYLDNAYRASRYHARLELLRAADVLLALSEQSRIDAMRLLSIDGDRIAVIGGGVSAAFRPVLPGDQPQQVVRTSLPSVRGPFVLSVIGAEERKNVERLLEAWALLPRDLRSSLQLVLVGRLRPDFAARWHAQAARVGLRESEVVFTDWIPDSLLRALYQSARLSVFPSLYEGFGLPVAEAAASDCPVITSNCPPVPEILDYPPSVFDGRDVGEMSALIERGATDEGFSAELVNAARCNAPRHTWEAVTSRTLGAVRRLEWDGWDGWRAPRVRIALCGPFSESASGVARHNRGIATALAKRCDVEVFWTDRGGRPGSQRGLRNLRCLPFAALGWTANPASYDVVLYSLEDPRPLPYPGVVWHHATPRPSAPAPGPGVLRRLAAALARRWFDEAAANLIAPAPGPTTGMPPRALVVASEAALSQAPPGTHLIAEGRDFDAIAGDFVKLLDSLPPLLPTVERAP